MRHMAMRTASPASVKIGNFMRMLPVTANASSICSDSEEFHEQPLVQ